MKRAWWMVVGVIGLATAALAETNWPSWRGPQLNGVAEGGKYPTTWSATEHVRWKIALPGPGASTPAVWGDQIFLTCGIEGRNAVVGFNRAGKEQWRLLLDAEKPGKHKKATGSNSSPVTDGKHLYVYFKNGTLACLDLNGKLVWQKNLQSLYGEDTLWWDLGTSPVLSSRHLIVAVMHSGPSYLAAFDKQTGEVAWKQDRNLDAPSEAAQSYSTPIVLGEGKQETIVVLGADHVTAHDAPSGKELWRVGGLNPTGHQYFRSISSPVAAGNLIVAPYARGATITAIRLGGQGDVTNTHVAWTKTGLGADVPTPAALGDRVFLCTDKGEVACLEAASGEVVWQGGLEKHRLAFSASPIVAGGHVYLTREDGKTFVVSTGPSFQVVAANELDGEMVVATPVFVDGQILIRTLEHLYCIGE